MGALGSGAHDGLTDPHLVTTTPAPGPLTRLPSYLPEAAVPPGVTAVSRARRNSWRPGAVWIFIHQGRPSGILTKATHSLEPVSHHCLVVEATFGWTHCFPSKAVNLFIKIKENEHLIGDQQPRRLLEGSCSCPQEPAASTAHCLQGLPWTQRYGQVMGGR